MVRRGFWVAVVFGAVVVSTVATPAGGPAPLVAASQAEKAGKLSRDWKRVRTPSFEAVTNGSVDEVRRVLDQLEVFRTNLVTRFLRLRTAAPLPTLVVVFKGDGAFDRFKPRDEKGKRRDFVGAYFLQGPDMNHIVLPKAQGEDLRLVFHEYYHYVADRNTRVLPIWLSEGMSEYYSTSEFVPERGQSVIGKIIPWHIQFLRMDPLIPLDQLLSNDGAHKILRGDPRRVAMLYAQSWALVHYLMLDANAARAEQIPAYLEALEKGLSLEQAFRSAFGLTYQEATKALSSYIGRNAFPLMTVTQDAATISGGSTVEALTEAEAEHVQGDLLMRLGAKEEAERSLAKALALDPAFVPAKVALAQLRVSQDRETEAIEMLTPIAEAEPGNFAAQLALGSACMKGERHEQALKAFARAAAANDKAPGAWSGTALATLALGRHEESDRAIARLQEMEPGAKWYQGRGYGAFGLADFAAAARDARSYITQAGRGAESAPYMAFLGAISLWRLERGAEAEALLGEVRPDLVADTWTMKVMDFMQGRLTADRFLAAAKDVEQQTEAHAYVGFKALQAGRRDEATTQFKWVKERGTSTYVEHRMAVAELKRLEKPAAGR